MSALESLTPEGTAREAVRQAYGTEGDQTPQPGSPEQPPEWVDALGRVVTATDLNAPAAGTIVDEETGNERRKTYRDYLNSEYGPENTGWRWDEAEFKAQNETRGQEAKESNRLVREALQNQMAGQGYQVGGVNPGSSKSHDPEGRVLVSPQVYEAHQQGRES